MYVQIHTIAFI